MFAGQDALVIVDFNRFNMPVISAARSMPNTGGLEGANAVGDDGTLMILSPKGLTT